MLQNVNSVNMKKKDFNKIKKFSTFKKKKPLERQVADNLVKQHERNEKLREKKIDTKFFDLF